MNIRDGIYNEQILMYSVPGTSSVNTVTFQSESGDSSAVTVQFAGTPINNYVIKLSGADYINFHQMGVHNTNTVSTTCLYLENTRCVRTDRSMLWAPTSGSTSSALVYATGADSVLVDQNNLIGSRSAFYPVSSYNLYVRNNTMADQSRYALYTTFLRSLYFEKNEITSNTTLVFIAISISNAQDTLSISGNRINSPGTAISITNSSGTVARTLKFYNNMIASASDDDCVILGNGCGDLDFCHNTINYSGDGYALYLISFFNINVLNNIFCSAGNGAVYRLSSTNTAVVDYNVVYSANDTVARFSVANILYPDFNLWQSACGRDIHSVYALPQFASPTDLHLLSDCSQNMPCNIFDTISVDADGDLRDVVSPYPGADELINTGYAADAGTMYFRFSTPPTCSGSATTTVTIRNHGTQILNSCVINWSINSVMQTPVVWNGSLTNWDTAQVTVGVISYTPHNMYDVVAWTSSPNGQTDSASVNDSLAHYSFITGFSGNYTIGGVAPDFATINDAVADLQIYGVCGPATFFIRNGMYNEQFEIQDVRGTSAINLIRFTSESGDSSLVTIYFDSNNSTDNHIVKLNACDHVNFDHLTFRKDGSTYNRIIHIDNGVTYSNVANCFFSCGNAGSTVDDASLYCSVYSAPEDSYNTISTCRFEGGYCGISILGNTSSDETGNHVTNCVCIDQVYTSINLQYQNDINCTENTTIRTTNFADYGIRIKSGQNNVMIEKNYIQGDFQWGMYFESCNWTTSANPVQVINNMIALTTSGPNYALRGIGVINCTGDLLIAFNNINLYNSANVTNGAVILITGGPNVKAYNNNLCGPGIVTGFWVTSPVGSSFEVENNNYDVGADLMVNTYTSTVYTTIASLNVDGFELNGITVDPMYTNDTNLHVNQPLLCGTGLSMAGIIDDFDGDFRSAVPSIGADEIAGPVSAIQHNANGCAPQTVQFNAGGNPSLYTFSWNFGDPTTSADTASIPNPTYTYNSIGTYTATLHMTGTSACGGSDSTFVIITLTSTGPTVTFTSATDTMCLNDAALFLSGGFPLGGTYTGNGVSGGMFTPIVAGIGNETITYAYTDTAGCVATATHDIYVDQCVGFQEQTQTRSLEVFPNPASDAITIVISSCQEEFYLDIINSLGEVVLSETATCKNETLVHRSDISALAPGLYHVRVQTTNNVIMKAFICE